MMIQITSQKAFITEHLAKHIYDVCRQELHDRETSTFQNNLVVGDSFTELVRLQMREIATDRSDRWYWGGSTLDQAIQKVLSDVKSYLPDSMDVNFSNHEEHARKTLKFVAKEINELQGKLQYAWDQEEVLDHYRFTNDVEVQFEIVSIGTRQSLEGLLLTPMGEQKCILNLENLDRTWTLSGDWFPFQLAIGDLTFVIDDDGTVFISTDNLPETLISQIRDLLCQIAQSLYISEPTDEVV